MLSLVVACFAPAAYAQDTQYTAVASIVNAPTLPFSHPSYAANGNFTVLVTNGSCAGTYTVNAAPIAGSGPSGSTPPLTTVTTYINFPQGSFFFGNAGSGQYRVTVTETGACNPPVDPVIFDVTVPAVAVTPYTVSSSVVNTSIPFGEAGYSSNGSFTISIANGNCTGTYTVNATPVTSSSPDGSTPPNTSVVTYIGFGQGNFLFANAGVGRYRVTINETGPCQFASGEDPTIFEVQVGLVPIPKAAAVPVNTPLAIALAALVLLGSGALRLRRR